MLVRPSGSAVARVHWPGALYHPNFPTAGLTMAEQVGDPTLADGILDRLVHNARRMEMRGDSMRKYRKPDIPRPISNPCFHRRCHAQCSMQPAEVVYSPNPAPHRVTAPSCYVV